MVELAVAAKSREKAGIPPFYRPIRDECLLFEKAFALKLPLLLKGPTGCGKTRFVSHMAARLGLQPESLSRTFAKLRSLGITVQAANVAVGDVAKLRRLARDGRSAIRGILHR